MGPPGSGKGTQASYIAEILDVNSVSTGDLFRDNLAWGTELGILAKGYMERGEYVPDNVTVNMIMEWINDSKNNSGFVLDLIIRAARRGFLAIELRAMASFPQSSSYGSTSKAPNLDPETCFHAFFNSDAVNGPLPL